MNNVYNFALKYRPQKFSEVVNQKEIVMILKHIVSFQKIHHAYLFSGMHGVGKTTVARIFARAINCQKNQLGESCDLKKKQNQICSNCWNNFQNNQNIIEIDAASNNSVDNIRELQELALIRPFSGAYKIYIIDEVHMLSIGAFNAFLKLLEEPPKHVIFILATTEMRKIPETILSRCQRFQFKAIEKNDLATYLGKIANKEGITFEKKALEIIVKQVQGSVRDALNNLSQIALLNPGIKLKEIAVNNHFGLLNYQTQIDFLNLLFGKNIEQVKNQIEIYSKNHFNFRKLTESLLKIIQNEAFNFQKNPKNYSKEGLLVLPTNFVYQDFQKIIKIVLNFVSKFWLFFNKSLLFELMVFEIIDYITNQNAIIKNNYQSFLIEEEIEEEKDSISQDEFNYLFKNNKYTILKQVQNKWIHLNNYQRFPLYEKLTTNLLKTKPVLYYQNQLVLVTKDNQTFNYLNDATNFPLLNKFAEKFFNKECKFIVLKDQKWQSWKNMFVMEKNN